jgi:glycosyltransferase involved in cell wall biosynthesis
VRLGKRIFTPLASNSVSVVIPTFNRAETLSRAINSVINQTHKNLEIIIIDDGSTDETQRIVAEFEHRGNCLSYVRVQSNTGAQAARIQGIKLAKGRYLAFLDSDDELVQNSISARLDSLANSGFGDALVYGDVILAHSVVRLKQLRGPSYHYLTKELSLCPFSTMLVPRICFSKAQLPSADFPSWQDDDMILALGKVFPMLHCGQVVALMHPGPESITLNRSKLAKGCKMIVKKYRQDILIEHGVFRLMLWNLRILRAHLLAELDDCSSIASRNRLIRRLVHKVCGLLDRILVGFFERMYA